MSMSLHPMLRSMLLLMHLLTLSLGVVSTASADPHLVRVREGLLAGVAGRDPDVRVFKGVPYAAAPTGELRWQPPQPPQPWQGVRRVDRFAPACMQAPREPGSLYQLEFMPEPQEVDEDCLYLNIWSAGDQPRPVMVWLYPGGFVWGSGASPVFDGEALARKGVVLVTLNYRVGAFGFLAHPELSAESGHKASGNYGLHDQIAALRWVQDNIAAFGGDPGNVTIFGLSAGAISSHILTASPLAKGLFHKVIAQSGSAYAMRAQTPLVEAERAGQAFVDAAGVGSIEALRKVPAQDLMALRLRTMPVVDGWLLPQDIGTIFREGRQNDVPLMAGGTTSEGSAMPSGRLSVTQWRDMAARQYGTQADTFLRLYPHLSEEQAWDAMVTSLSDRTFWGAHAWASEQARTGSSPAFLYTFDRAPPGRNSAFYGAYHCADIAYVFDNLWAIDRPWTDVDRQLASDMSAAWVRFAHTGDPNGPNLEAWPPYDPEHGEAMLFGTDSHIGPGARDKDVLRFLDRDLKEGRESSSS